MIIELLSTLHERIAFNCGESSLNDFLQRYARQNDSKGLGRTYVAIPSGESRILGYYTLSSGAITFDTIPENLPHYPIPAFHLGRLAVDIGSQGQHIGETLLLDALKRSLVLSEQIGVYAVTVFALNDRAKSFYLKYDFAPLLDDPYHLYLKIKQIRNLGL